MLNPLELIEKYAKDIELDTDVNAANLQEKLYNAPQTKHKWLYKMIQSKIALAELNEKKNDLIQEALGKDVLGMSKVQVKSKVEKSRDVFELNKQIKNQELLVEYLDRTVDKVFSQMGYDFKNLVDLIKIEQLT